MFVGISLPMQSLGELTLEGSEWVVIVQGETWLLFCLSGTGTESLDHSLPFKYSSTPGCRQVSPCSGREDPAFQKGDLEISANTLIDEHNHSSLLSMEFGR